MQPKGRTDQYLQREMRSGLLPNACEVSVQTHEQQKPSAQGVSMHEEAQTLLLAQVQAKLISIVTPVEWIFFALGITRSARSSGGISSQYLMGKVDFHNSSIAQNKASSKEFG